MTIPSTGWPYLVSFSARDLALVIVGLHCAEAWIRTTQSPVQRELPISLQLRSERE